VALLPEINFQQMRGKAPSGSRRDGFDDVDIYLPADQIDRLIHLLIAARERLRTA
jgi:hypothetical protein